MVSGDYRKTKAQAVKDNKCFSAPVFWRPRDEDEGKLRETGCDGEKILASLGPAIINR